MKSDILLTVATKVAFGGLLLASLISCSSGPEKMKPADLAPNAGLLGVRLAWNSKVGPVDFGLTVKVTGNTVAVASSDGTVAAFDASSGAAQWRAQVGGPIAAGVGSDGTFAAVVTRANELVVLETGREIWRQKMPAQAYTAPLVAG